MPVNTTFSTGVTTVETPSTGVPAIDPNQKVSQSQYNTALQLTATTTPNTKKSVKEVYTLTSGAVSIDLTNLVGLGGGAVSFSGSKLRILKIKAPSGNGAAITIAKGASNGFTGLGASFDVTLPPGAEVCFYDGGNGTAVSGTLKTLDISGTGSTDTVQVELVAGD